MMKKLLSGALLLTALGTVQAQSKFIRADRKAVQADILMNFNSQNPVVASKSSAITETDTLWYFYNKHKFKNTVANQPFYTIPLSVGTSTDGDFVEYGSAFLNTSTNSPITVNGVIVLCSRQANSPSPSIPVRVYLYNANATGMPTTKVDSVNINVTNTNGQFNIATFPNPKTVTGSFFVSYKTMTTNTADTLLAWVSSAANNANTSVPVNERFGEGLSYVRGVVVPTPALNQFFITQDFLFGPGFDPEAIVAPMVTYSINANYNVSAPTSTATPGSYCTNQSINFVNTTNPNSVVYNRQFNFNRFISYWAPTTFSNNVLPDPADPIDNWHFSFAANTLTTTNVTTSVTTAGPFTATLEIKYRHSPFQPNAQMPSVSDFKSGSYTAVSCVTTPTSTVGMNEVSGFESVSVFPNPTVSGKTTITGLSGINKVMVYDMLGQLVLSQVSEKDSVSVDLINQANGNYIVKIINASNSMKVMKIINQN